MQPFIGRAKAKDLPITDTAGHTRGPSMAAWILLHHRHQTSSLDIVPVPMSEHHSTEPTWIQSPDPPTAASHRTGASDSERHRSSATKHRGEVEAYTAKSPASGFSYRVPRSRYSKADCCWNRHDVCDPIRLRFDPFAIRSFIPSDADSPTIGNTEREF